MKLIIVAEAKSQEECIALVSGWAEIAKAGDPKYKTLKVKGTCEAAWAPSERGEQR